MLQFLTRIDNARDRALLNKGEMVGEAVEDGEVGLRLGSTHVGKSRPPVMYFHCCGRPREGMQLTPPHFEFQ